MRTEKAIRQSTEKLRAHVERHSRLLLAALEEGPELERPELCPHLSCPHERRLREVLLETIKVLEGTRKAFKSKQLGRLRSYCRTMSVTRPSEKPEGKEAGTERPEAWPEATLRTFCVNDAAIRFRSQPQ